MKRSLLVTIGIGVGWVLGVVVSMISMPLGGNLDYSIREAIGNTFVFGFPGLIMLLISLVLSLRDDIEEDVYKGEF